MNIFLQIVFKTIKNFRFVVNFLKINYNTKGLVCYDMHEYYKPYFC